MERNQEHMYFLNERIRHKQDQKPDWSPEKGSAHKTKWMRALCCGILTLYLIMGSICGAEEAGRKTTGTGSVSLSALTIALASDYEEELQWSQMETALLDGNSVEWILSESIYGQAEAVEPNWRIDITPEELDLLEKCVMAEGGGESYECQVAIACVVINRVLSDLFPGTLMEVVTQEGQFSSWPNQISQVTATNSVRQAVREALAQAVFPEEILYFRADYYHSWGTEYCRIDHTYFSTQ